MALLTNNFKHPFPFRFIDHMKPVGPNELTRWMKNSFSNIAR